MPAATGINLKDTAIVFERRVGNETLDFGVSAGLLYNSTLLVYDRRPSWRDESLWSPLQGRAVQDRRLEQSDPDDRPEHGPAGRSGERSIPRPW
ncbi:MAG: DUF3179 domain-containing (seleno)protein [Acidobacteriota bacterium]